MVSDGGVSREADGGVSPAAEAFAEGVRHVYMHMPFCAARCPYCDYPVDLGPASLPEWAGTLGEELRLRADEGERLTAPVRTLHLGGGTPSILGSDLPAGVRALFSATGFALDSVEEWGIESNPEDLSAELLARWRNDGVDRVVVGVQSLRPEVLRFLGRRHSTLSAQEAMRAVEKTGFRSWGIDFVWGLPHEVESDAVGALRRILEFGVPHVSLFELNPEVGTPLGLAVTRREVLLPDDDRRADLYLGLTQALLSAGYSGHDPMSFALPGHGSRHAEAVREGEDYLGLGPGAHSWVRGKRSWNLGGWAEYREAVRVGHPPRAGAEEPNPEERSLERVWAALGSAQGLEIKRLAPEAGSVIERWVRSGWARTDPVRICLTPLGWIRLDSMVLELAPYASFR